MLLPVTMPNPYPPERRLHSVPDDSNIIVGWEETFGFTENSP